MYNIIHNISNFLSISTLTSSAVLAMIGGHFIWVVYSLLGLSSAIILTALKLLPDIEDNKEVNIKSTFTYAAVTSMITAPTAIMGGFGAEVFISSILHKLSPNIDPQIAVFGIVGLISISAIHIMKWLPNFFSEKLKKATSIQFKIIKKDFDENSDK